jgi:hypothetical protein
MLYRHRLGGLFTLRMRLRILQPPPDGTSWEEWLDTRGTPGIGEIELGRGRSK